MRTHLVEASTRDLHGRNPIVSNTLDLAGRLTPAEHAQAMTSALQLAMHRFRDSIVADIRTYDREHRPYDDRD